MTREEKWALWKLYPEIWELFEKFNGVMSADDEAWARLADEADRIGAAHGSPIVWELLSETLTDLEGMDKRRRGE